MELLFCLIIVFASIIGGIFLGINSTLTGLIVFSVIYLFLIFVVFKPSLLDDAGITSSGIFLGLVVMWLSAISRNDEYIKPYIDYVVKVLFKS